VLEFSITPELDWLTVLTMDHPVPNVIHIHHVQVQVGGETSRQMQLPEHAFILCALFKECLQLQLGATV